MPAGCRRDTRTPLQRDKRIQRVCQTFGPRARELFFFSPSPLPFLCCVFFYSLRACGHPVLTCRLCRAAAERLFGLLVVPSFRQLCKEEPGLCGYRGHVRGSEYRFYLFPPPTSHLSSFFLLLSLLLSSVSLSLSLGLSLQ